MAVTSHLQPIESVDSTQHRMKRFFTNQRLIYWIFVTVLMIPNIGMFYTESTGLLTRVIALVLPAGFYMTAFTWRKRPGVMFWWLFLLVFIGAFQTFLLFLYGESPIAVDMYLNVVTTNVTEASELLANLLGGFVFVIGVYGGSIALAVVSQRAERVLDDAFRRRLCRVGMALMAAGAVMLGVNYAVDKRFRLLDDVFPVNGVYNMVLAVERFSDGITRVDDWKAFDAQAVCERPDSVPEVYVLVIGETARADNFAVYGYERPTTPRMSALGDSVVVFRDALTMSNTTHKSVPLLLSAAACQQSMDSLYTQCGLINAFATTGFATAYYSNQRRNHSFIDRFGSEAAEVRFLKDSLLLANVYDEELLPLVDDRLARYDGGKLLIVLHTYGSHFKYHDRYPEEQAYFTPENPVSAELILRDELINGYDNTVRYADYIVGSVIARLDSLDVPAAVIYTSDHGEDIYDDSRGRFLHASPIPTYWQTRVPLVVWASGEYRNAHPDRWIALRGNANRPVATNMVLYHTLLDMAGITTRLSRADLSLANFRYCAPQRLYVTDHNEFVPLDRAGFKRLDIADFERAGVVYP